MEAKELRVGNLVICKHFEKTFEEGNRKTIIHREVVTVLGYDGINKRVLIKPQSKRKKRNVVSYWVYKTN